MVAAHEAAEKSYNDAVMKYNNAIQTFPAVVVASVFHFDVRESFDAHEAAEGAPVVSFSQEHATTGGNGTTEK